jgi:hypothetical protein
VTPAERLLAAADLLDKRAEAAAQPWLRAEANRVVNGPRVFGGQELLFTVSPEAVAVADLILAGAA